MNKNLDRDMPYSDYRAMENLGSTDISRILDNARKFNKIRTGEYEESKQAFEFGKAFHIALLEPERVADTIAVTTSASLRLQDIAKKNNFMIADCRGKTAKVYKDLCDEYPEKDILIIPEFEQVEFFQKNQGKIFLTEEDWATIAQCKKNALAVPGFEKYLENGKTEQSFFGEIDGVPVKARIDLLVTLEDGMVLVFDPKTTGKEATEKTFIQSSASNNYYLQEWLYTEVLRQNDILVKDYLFLLCSSLEYSGAGYFKHDYIAMERAAEEVQKACKKYKHCTAKNEWSESKFNFAENRFELVSEVTLPNYIFYKYE